METRNSSSSVIFFTGSLEVIFLSAGKLMWEIQIRNKNFTIPRKGVNNFIRKNNMIIISNLTLQRTSTYSPIQMTAATAQKKAPEYQL